MFAAQDRKNSPMPVVVIREQKIEPILLKEFASVFQHCFNGPPWNEDWTTEGAREHLKSEYVASNGIFVF